MQTGKFPGEILASTKFSRYFFFDRALQASDLVRGLHERSHTDMGQNFNGQIWLLNSGEREEMMANMHGAYAAATLHGGSLRGTAPGRLQWHPARSLSSSNSRILFRIKF